MRIKKDHFVGILIASAIILANLGMSFAADTDFEMRSVEMTANVNDLGEIVDFEGEDPEKVTRVDPEEEARIEEILSKQQNFLSKINAELNMSKTDYKQLLTTIATTKERLETVTDEKMTLERQLRNIDDLILLTTDKLFNVLKQIVEKENEIALLYEQIEIKEIALNYQTDLLKEYIQIMYQYEKTYFDFDNEGNIDAFKLLLADGTVGENLKELQYLNLLNEAGQQMVDELDTLSQELDAHKKRLLDKKAKLIELQNSLKVEKEQLEFQKTAKENLLSLTKGREEIYSKLLDQSIAEQEAVLNDVKNLSIAVNFIEKKIEKDGLDFDPDQYRALLDYKTQALYDFHINNEYLDIDDFVWPVPTTRGISAYFRDPGYVGIFGIQHNAIDLPVPQGSSVRATADAVVYTVRDNGYGYSYIILAHAGGFMSVYGHMSNILVDEGQMVAAGSVIGLSGGMPGTIGAGYMTTGPHLHFEMLSNGLYVDPLNYMPLEVLTEEQVKGQLPEKYWDDWDLAIASVFAEPVLREATAVVE